MPVLVFRRDHLRSTSGIICGSGSFAVQFGDHFRSGIICGRGSFAALYRCKTSDTLTLCVSVQWTSCQSNLVKGSGIGSPPRNRLFMLHYMLENI